jgi:hypothetical protein
VTPIGTEIAGRNAIARDDQVTSIGFIAAARQGGEVGAVAFGRTPGGMANWRKGWDSLAIEIIQLFAIW